MHTDDENGEEYDVSDLIRSRHREDNRDIEEMEGMQEVHGFTQEFKRWLKQKTRRNTAILLSFITDLALAGNTRSEIREEFLNSGLKTRDGKPVNIDTWKHAIQVWADMLRVFAADKESPWSQTPVARAILNRATQLGSKKKAGLLGNLVIAGEC